MDATILKYGAEGRSRTGTGVTHYPLKIACLPIPPLRHVNVFYSVVEGEEDSSAIGDGSAGTASMGCCSEVGAS